MRYQLFLFDVDSTLIQQEVIDLLAAKTPFASRVSDITERAMRGEIDFDAALLERVSCLQGLSESVFSEVINEISFTPGAEQLIMELQARGAKIGVVSGGFHNVIDPLLKHLKLDFIRANKLEVKAGVLSGQVMGPIINRSAKQKALREFAFSHNIDLALTVAVGDGSNDLEMIQSAGLGVSFCGKPILQSAADVAINEQNLLKLLDEI